MIVNGRVAFANSVTGMDAKEILLVIAANGKAFRKLDLFPTSAKNVISGLPMEHKMVPVLLDTGDHVMVTQWGLLDDNWTEKPVIPDNHPNGNRKVIAAYVIW